jgi:hypothetical protein
MPDNFAMLPEKSKIISAPSYPISVLRVNFFKLNAKFCQIFTE